MKKVLIEIPDEFENDLKDKFDDFFGRVKADLRDYPSHDKLCGNYEMETIDMFLKSFNSCKVLDEKDLEPSVDAISRKAVVQWLEHATDDSIEHAIDSDLEFISSVTPTQKWVSVSEELPKEPIYEEFVEPSEPVLVQLNNGEMKVSRYWGSRESYKDEPWIDLSHPTTLEVVAWMPLPKSYEKENQRLDVKEDIEEEIEL